MRTGLVSRAALLAAAASLVTSSALADLPAQSGIPEPGRSLAGNDDASANRQNPANLGFLPAPELRWLWFRTGSESTYQNRGHAFDLGLPLFFGLSTGFSVELVRPPEALASHLYRWLTWGVAFKPSDSFALGASIARSYSNDVQKDALLGVSTSFTWRPNAYLGASAALRNWNTYRNSDRARLDRGYDLGLIVRPTGHRVFELGLEASHTQSDLSASGDARWVPRLTMGLDVPYIGRLRGDVSVRRPFDNDTREYIATAGLDINGVASQASGGAIFGNGLGPDKTGYYMGLAVRGYREPGLPDPKHYVKIRLEKTPDARGHVRLLRSLWRMAESPEVDGVALVLKAEPASSFAHAEELGDAVRMLRIRGKKVFCSLEDSAGRSLYVCAQADRIVINPGGAIRLAGLRAQYMYYGDLLTKLGVRAEFARIGEHKTAAESYALNGPTPTADADHDDLLRQLERSFIHDIGGGRHISMSDLRARIARGPFLAKEAREAGLVDSYAFDDEMEQVASEVAGHPVALVDSKESTVFMKPAPDVMGERDRVAVVYVDGDMVDGRSQNIPLIGNKLAGGYTIVEALKQAREDPRVKSIVLRVETPGGATIAAENIWREVEITKRVKPVIVSMGATAASAGYYISAGASMIFANRSTITGSIGIFFPKVDVQELLKKLGISVVTYKTASRADAESIYRPLTDDERKELGNKVKQLYDVFVDRVARGRSMSPDQVDAIARGRVWTGEQALERKLIDRLGGLREAVEEAERRGGLAHGAPLIELPYEPKSLLGVALSLAGVGEDESKPEAKLPVPQGLLDMGRALAPYAYFDDRPIARMELLIETP